jgi:FlaA1/EpsC-like NDP-sugar epimerase
MKNDYENKIILVTGGCGSIGSEIVRQILQYKPKQIRIFDNRETALFHLQHELAEYNNLRFLVGDIREKERLNMALENVDVVFHAAALKHVHYCERNPFETMKTNVQGTQNVIEACLHNNVGKMINISTDKATNAINTLGASKLMAERLVNAAQYYVGDKRTKFCSVRFGNVIGSDGSVIDLFKQQLRRKQDLTVTHPEMTRFIMTIPEAVELVLKAAEFMKGGEVFVLKMPTFKLQDLVDAIKEHYDYEGTTNIKYIGLRPGEKMYEELMTEEEAVNALETEELLIIQSDFNQMVGLQKTYAHATKTSKKIFSSRDNKHLDKKELKEFLIKKKILT